MRRRWFVYGLFIALLLLLSGCFLISGQRISEEPPGTGLVGEWSAAFVSADGEDEVEFLVERPDVPVYLDVTATVEWGELILEFNPADAEEEDLVTVEARYGRTDRNQAVVRSDEAGLVHFTLRAVEARNGSYTILYRFQAPPTPTPTPTPTMTPTPSPTPLP